MTQKKNNIYCNVDYYCNYCNIFSGVTISFS